MEQYALDADCLGACFSRNLEVTQAFLQEKERMRRELAQLPFEEKIRWLRRLWELVASIQEHRPQVLERLKQHRFKWTT